VDKSRRGVAKGATPLAGCPGWADDPTIGIMHEKKAPHGINPGFALDHMEPMRPVVDRAVLQLIDEVTFTGRDFSIQHDGVCRTNPELALRVAQLALERCGIPNSPTS
jgi:CRISPR/Cas system-associated endonuclease Cas1